MFKMIEITKNSMYFNDKGKVVKGPIYNLQILFPGDTIMVYEYEHKVHVQAKVDKVDPLELTYSYGNNMGTYSSASAAKLVKNTELPHIYKVSDL